MRKSVMGALALVLPLLAACSEDPEPIPQPQPPLEEIDPSYDPTQQAAAAVMSLVPASATELRVTDFDQIRLSLGFGGTITSESPAGERKRFWRKAERRAPVLDAMLKDHEAELDGYDFGPDDVVYEAHFSGPDGEGWVLKFRDDLSMKSVKQAAKAGVAGLKDAVVVTQAHVAAVGATREPTESWANNRTLRALVGTAAAATYVDAGCLPFQEAFGIPESDLAPGPAEALAALDPLEAYSVSFGVQLITVRLGELRDDAFDRARLADILPATSPEFGVGFTRSVADPGGGRIGYRIGDIAATVDLTLDHHLPFALCAPEAQDPA